MLIIDRICHFISSDIGLTLKIQKTVNKICHRLSIFECLGALIYSNVMIAMQCIPCKANLTFRSVFFLPDTLKP